jgi:hypothetical protein
MNPRQFCIHAHFSQAAQGNPLSNKGVAGAVPHPQTVAEAAASCYVPNAELGNFRQISFSVNTVLLQWLAVNQPNTYRKIREADQATEGALAMPFHDVALPRVARPYLQIQWGLHTFEHHFGRKPQGFWLPHMAVNTAILKTLATSGVLYVVLDAQQVRGQWVGGPYTLHLPEGQQIGVFIRSEALSHDLAFRIAQLGGADTWTNTTVRRHSGNAFTLAATDGETFGYHHAQEAYFLQWLVSRSLRQVDLTPTTLAYRYQNTAPAGTLQLIEDSSWHPSGLGWLDATPWHIALRDGIDTVFKRLEEYYRLLAGAVAWPLMEDYIEVLLGETDAIPLIERHLPGAPAATVATLQTLLTAQELVMRAQHANAFLSTSLTDSAPRYSVACIALAAAMTERAIGISDILNDLEEKLAAVGGGTALLAEIRSQYDL